MGRMEKINAAFQREIGLIIQNELKDPRVSFVTINRVEVTKDLSYAKVYFGVCGTKEKAEDALDGLKSAAGYIRKLLAKAVDLRHTPELRFKLDTSTEHSVFIAQEIERIAHEHTKGD